MRTTYNYDDMLQERERDRELDRKRAGKRDRDRARRDRDRQRRAARQAKYAPTSIAHLTGGEE